MKRFITILIGCSLTLAVGVRAEQEDPKKKPVQKSKPVQKQQFTLTNARSAEYPRPKPPHAARPESLQREGPQQQLLKAAAPYTACRSLKQDAPGSHKPVARGSDKTRCRFTKPVARGSNKQVAPGSDKQVAPGSDKQVAWGPDKPANSAENSISAREFSRETEHIGYQRAVQSTLPHQRESELAGPPIQRFQNVPAPMARQGLVALASQSHPLDRRWVVLLECWILVSGLGLRYGRCLLPIRWAHLRGQPPEAVRSSSCRCAVHLARAGLLSWRSGRPGRPADPGSAGRLSERPGS